MRKSKNARGMHRSKSCVYTEPIINAKKSKKDDDELKNTKA